MPLPTINLADWLPEDRGIGAVDFEAAVFAPNEWMLAQSQGTISLVIGGLALKVAGLGWCSIEVVTLPHVVAGQPTLSARFVPSQAYGTQDCEFRPPVIADGIREQPLIAGETVAFEPAGLTYTPDQFRALARLMTPGQSYDSADWLGYFARLGLIRGRTYSIELSHPAGFVKVGGCDYVLSCELFHRAP